jgi:hypothetical protein
VLEREGEREREKKVSGLRWVLSQEGRSRLRREGRNEATCWSVETGRSEGRHVFFLVLPVFSGLMHFSVCGS